VPQRFEVLLAAAADWRNASRLPYTLREAGCRVTLLCSRSHLAWATRYADVRIDAPADVNAFVEFFKRHLADNVYDWVIIADDPLLYTLAERADERQLDAVFPVDLRDGAARFVTSKSGFVEGCARAGLRVPPFRTCLDVTTALDAAEAFGYPVVVKADLSSAGDRVRVADDRAALIAAHAELADGKPVSVQAFVQGNVGMTEILYRRGEPVCYASWYKTRCWPTQLGGSSVRQAVDHRDVLPMITRLGALAKMHGLASMDWIHEKAADALTLIEFNARPSSAMHLRRPGRSSLFARGIRMMLEGKTPTPALVGETGGALVRLFPQNLFQVVAEKDVAGMLAWLPGLPSSADFPWHDPSLLASHVLRGVSKTFSRPRGLALRHEPVS
jgi:predicted ATP-grasp superfamily ATP-dependent carboligase